MGLQKSVFIQSIVLLIILVVGIFGALYMMGAFENGFSLDFSKMGMKQ
jgi:hypothetical protein